MRLWRPASLEARLVVRLGALSIAGMTAGVIVLVISSYRAAMERGNELLMDGFVREFLRDAAWAFPLGAIAALALSAWTIRTSLSPVRRASQKAAAIKPGVEGVRLPLDDLPSEVLPLVTAVNAALDRLERGVEMQRQFTANAAHELRTPLAILSAGLEALPLTSEAERLRLDAERMSRLVSQLLRVARLDARPLDLSQTIDLGEVASEVVEHLAPWAIRHDRNLGFEPAGGPVAVRGDRDALADAIRNLVENALAHSPEGGEVTVRVDGQGEVSVLDHGVGVPAELRERIFERFWRSPERRGSGVGAGLGLSIVAETARAHAGQVTVDEAAGGGACFTLTLPLVTAGIAPPATNRLADGERYEGAYFGAMTRSTARPSTFRRGK